MVRVEFSMLEYNLTSSNDCSIIFNSIAILSKNQEAIINKCAYKIRFFHKAFLGMLAI